MMGTSFYYLAGGIKSLRVYSPPLWGENWLIASNELAKLIFRCLRRGALLLRGAST